MDDGLNPPNEVEQLRKELHDGLAHSNSQITQLLGVLVNIQSRLPPPQENPHHDDEEEEEIPHQEQPADNPQLTEMKAKLARLEESILRQEKATNVGFDMSKLCLFPDAKLPAKFKPIDFEKFDGTGNPQGHIQTYVSSLSLQGVDENTMAQMFHQTLKGAALQWFLLLDISKKRTWEGIAAAFIKQYNYNIELEVTTRELESIKMGEKETFAEFVQRWRARAALMTDRPGDKEQMRILIRNLHPDLARNMVTAATSDFRAFYQAGMAVEDALRTGLIPRGESSNQPKPKRTYTENSLYTNPNYSLGTSSGLANNQPPKSEPVHNLSTQPNNTTQKARRNFTPLPVPMNVIFERLVQRGILKPLPPTLPPQNPPPTHNLNQFCAFHQGPGHLTERCWRLRHEIQDLIDSKRIADPNENPNIANNPLPLHRGNNNINQIALSSTPFDPSQFILPLTEPKPVVTLPSEPEVNMLYLDDYEMWQKYGGLLDKWGIDEQEMIDERREERDRARMGLEMDPVPNLMPVEEFEAFWEPVLADPLDGFALRDLFAEPEPVVEGPIELEEGGDRNWQEMAIEGENRDLGEGTQGRLGRSARRWGFDINVR